LFHKKRHPREKENAMSLEKKLIAEVLTAIKYQIVFKNEN